MNNRCLATLTSLDISSYGLMKVNLLLNVKKTKELLIEEHRARDTSLLQPVRIKAEDVESVKTFKYLGTVLDSNLSFITHVDTVYKKSKPTHVSNSKVEDVSC